MTDTIQTDRSYASRQPVIVTARENGEIAIHQVRCQQTVTVIIGPEQWAKFVEGLKVARTKAAERLAGGARVEVRT